MHAPRVYRPRKPRATALYQCAARHAPELKAIGRFGRGVEVNVVERFLACGDPQHGFARIYCDQCRHACILAFSCKARYFCPSCHQKRVLAYGEWVDANVLAPVPHRQYVFTLPRLLRPMFARHPQLLAQSVAGALRPQFRPPHMMAASNYSTPTVAADVVTLLADIGANRESSVMSPVYVAWYRTAIGWRAFASRRLQRVGPLTYLGHDDMTGRATWDGQPLDRIAYYKTDADGGVFILTVGLKDGKIARFGFAPY